MGKTLIIESGIIKDILDYSISENEVSIDRVIDCTGKYAIPGLFECHAHLAPLTGKSWLFRKIIQRTEKNRNHKESWEDFVVNRFRSFLEMGITQIRDVGGPVDKLESFKKDVESGDLQAPDIFYSGPMLEKSPLKWDMQNEELPGFSVAIDSSADLDLLEKLKDQGATHIKTFGKWNRDVFRKLIEFSSKLDLPVTHDPGGFLFHEIPVDYAVSEGVNCIEHMKSPLSCVLNTDLQDEHDKILNRKIENYKLRNSIPVKLKREMLDFVKKIVDLKADAISRTRLRSLFEKMKDEHVYLCPTLQIFEEQRNKMAGTGFVKKTMRLILRKKWGVLNALLKVNSVFAEEAVDAGVKILVGQDGFSPEGTIREMELLEENGFCREEILKGATMYPAEWLGVSHMYGTLYAGKKANICILNENHFDKISNMRSVYKVFKNGDEIV